MAKADVGDRCDRITSGAGGSPHILLALFLVSWVAQFFTQMIAFGNEARNRCEPFSLGDYPPAFFSTTFENSQNE